ncbi:F-box protein SNE-like [Dorcoceras hygrometricum]|uniref:F-box protein SNE-like n=1 Tax=Dorcoceras hygrometricum TaxID=472368 RepID=A0A2Z7CH27_9LAMI|nr:F-box protein SNE-like [Dorcoceras hygrometricum]
MVQVHEMVDNVEKRARFCINDNMDVLIEILKRLDDRSLGVAACVCRLWCGLARNDSLWMHLCFRHLAPPPEGVRTVVAALGGYRRLYMVCVKPVLRVRGGGGELDAEWSRHEVELSLSLFCVDYYERFLLGGGRMGGDSAATAASSSLMFLCNPINV